MLSFHLLIWKLNIVLLSCSRVIGTPVLQHETRESSNASSLVVDLGYGVYKGYYNATSQLNIFKGQQNPLCSTSNGKSTLAKTPTTSYQQNFDFSNKSISSTMSSKSGLGTEDCLYLSVWAPANATNLPVMFWIHGGGYGVGQGNFDFSPLLLTNSQRFIVVVIQYRIGAFGFLSSSSLVSSGGIPNAGLHDMYFALEWTQTHISKFGGDPSRVTIAGESAGGGAVMLMTMAYNGTVGAKLWNNAIVASPYLPMQYDYDGLMPEEGWRRFVGAVGCGEENGNGSAFECLVGKDTVTLQNASAYISATGEYGQWVFLPVTDGEFLVSRPSEQLLAGRSFRFIVQMHRTLTYPRTQNNANEGPLFVPPNITTSADFDTYTSTLFPLMPQSNLTALRALYSIPPITSTLRFSTLGNRGPSALNQSVFATGQQQRANNLYAETTFVCPSYWSATAFSLLPRGQAWKYEYDVPPAQHGGDYDAYLAGNREALGQGTLSAGFSAAVQRIWGSLIINDDPRLSADAIASIVSVGNGTETSSEFRAAEKGVWPLWRTGTGNGTGEEDYRMLKLNVTGGHETQVLFTTAGGFSYNVTQSAGPGLKADLEVVDAFSWEDGRGERCKFWAEVGRSLSRACTCKVNQGKRSSFDSRIGVAK
ncbi:Carboxylesterase type B protein [Rutstroemia sp. NJR-2017a BBW]|nr:Carboxylesterase type B protein [Rutstroemia sp. NJR-2017a BBW]